MTDTRDLHDPALRRRESLDLGPGALLGVTLFRRTSRRVALTEPGRVFLGEARALLRRSADAVEAARRAARGETGAPAIGHGSGTLDVVMPGAVRRFRECHPGVALRLAELDAPTIEALVGTGDLDVGLVCPPVGDAASWQRGGEPRRRRSWPLG